MAGAPALTKIVDALADRLRAMPQVNVFSDRDGSEALMREELPAIVINVLDVDITERPELGNAAQVHSATIHLDFYENFEVWSTITARHREMIAQAMAIIHADWSLGGMLRELNPIGISKADDVLADQGAAVLEIEIKFLTAFGDWTTGIGQSGTF